jgi:ABC-type branched-subunit amino acid transport system substrate-binding protein
VIGINAELSGAFSGLGLTADGAYAYIDMINKQGGVLGHKMTVVEADNESTASVSAAVVRRLILQDHATFVIGPAAGADAEAAVPVADSLDTVTIVEDGSGWPLPGVSSADSHSWSFTGIEPLAAADVDTIVQQVILPKHWTRVAEIADDTPFGLRFETALKADAAKYHLKIVSLQLATAGSTNDDAQALNMLAANPQIIINGTTDGSDTVTALKSIRAESATIPIGVCGDCTYPSFVATMGGPAVMQNVYAEPTPQQLLTALPHNKLNAPTFADTRLYLKEMAKFGYGSFDDITSGSNGWMAMEELVTAIKSAKSISQAAVRDAMEHQTLDTLGIFWYRTPQNTGYYNVQQSVIGTETVTPKGAFVPYP